MRLKSREALNQHLYVYKLPDDQFVSCTTKVRDSCKHIKHVVTDLKTNTLLGISLENSIDITLENITQHTKSDKPLSPQYTTAAYYVSNSLKAYLDASNGTYMKETKSTFYPRTTVYLLLDNSAIYQSINNYVDNSYQMPIDRLVIGFFRPDVSYSVLLDKTNKLFTFNNIGFGDDMSLNVITFTNLIKNIKKNCGVTEVYLSMGGWNFNCYPKFAQNSHSHRETRYWDGNSNIGNMYHHVCSPSGPTRHDYTFFPDPASKLEDDEIDYLSNNDIYQGWSIRISPGVSTKQPVIPKWQWGGTQTYNNLVNNESSCNGYNQKCEVNTEEEVIYNNFGYIDRAGREQIGPDEVIGQEVHPINCYDSFVKFAAKVGANGIDLDYEEAWHADTFKVANAGPALQQPDIGGGPGGPGKWKTEHGPYMFSQTKGKFARIVAVLRKAIANYGPNQLKLSMPGPAVGFNDTRYGNTSWYGGNLKGLYLNDEMCGDVYDTVPLTDSSLAYVSLHDSMGNLRPDEQGARKINARGCHIRHGHWFKYQDMFDNLGVSDIGYEVDSTSGALNYHFWNQIFDGGMFPMIYDLGGGVFKDASHAQLDSETGPIGTFECGPYISYYSADNLNLPYRPPGVAPYSCDLISQLKFYSDQYIDNGIHIALGFEIGLPNYPRADDTTNPVGDLSFDTTIIPDKKSFNIELSQNYTNFYNNFKEMDSKYKYKYGTFFWELFKQPPPLSNSPSANESDCIKTDFSFGWDPSQSYIPHKNGQILNDSSSNPVEAIDLSSLVNKMCIWKMGSTLSCEWPNYPELSGGFYDMSRTCISSSWMTSDNKYMQS